MFFTQDTSAAIVRAYNGAVPPIAPNRLPFGPLAVYPIAYASLPTTYSTAQIRAQKG